MLRRLTAKRIAQLVESFFQHYFHISAVRVLDPDSFAELASAPEDNHERRGVGADGMRTLDVLQWHSSQEHAGHFGAHLPWQGVEKQVADATKALLEIDLEDVKLEPRARFSSDYVVGPQVPKQFSSGFHQVFPIIVQLAVMEPGELLSIENPEVHLHPDLQLLVSEYLLDQTRKGTGRRIVIETHSDLIIRRVVRAILDEEDALSQQHVSLNFSKRENLSAPERPSHNVGSTLHSFGVDEAGRIEWPEGFMDASIKESQRLMDVMYGRRRPDEGEAAE